jgi:hypothetical protein
MAAEIVSQIDNELTLQVKIDLSGTMLEVEEKILLACQGIKFK